MNKILINKIFLFLCVFLSVKMHAQVNCVNENYFLDVTSTSSPSYSRIYPLNNDLYPTDALLTGYGSGNNYIYRATITGAPTRLKISAGLSNFGTIPSTNASMTIHSACPATLGNRIETFTGSNNQTKFVTFPTNGVYFFVFDEGSSTTGSYASLQISKTWETIQAGDWNSPTTWLDGIIPDTSYGMVNLNHNVFINTPAAKACGTISTGTNTLTINAGAVLTTGSTSMGNAYGNSNRSFNGNLIMDSGVFNINGGFYLGNFTFSGGTINVDANDGVGGGGSIFGTSVSSLTGTQDVTGGRINFLDGKFNSNELAYVNDCIFNYNGGANQSWGEGCIVTIGGGDDTPGLGVNKSKFGICCSQNYGTFTFGTLVVATGTIANNGGLYTYRTLSCKNLIVNAGSELHGSGLNKITIKQNLINNGLITSGDVVAPQNSDFRHGIVFSKEDFQRYSPSLTKFYNDFVAADYPQSIFGTGFFRNSLTAPIPTSQQDNIISNLQVYNLREFGGLTLNMPLKVERLNIGSGKINTTNTNLLTLGLGVDNATTGNVAEGILSAIPLTELSTTPTPASIANWNTGWVDGPFRRWFRASANTTEKTIMPVGDPADAQVCSIQFTTAPATAGYLISSFIKAPPTGGRNISLTDPAVSNSISYIADYGYWDVSPTVTNGVIGGTYTSSFLGKSFNANGAHPDFVQLKRPSGSLLATDWALPGVHVGSSSAGGVLVSRTGQMGFSEFAIGENLIPLAVNNIYLNGVANDLNNTLILKINNIEIGSKIELLRCESNQNVFTTVATQFSLMNKLTYNFNDYLATQATYSYKVKITSNNGVAKYSNIIVLNAKAITAVKAFPNPSKALFNVSYYAANDDNVQYRLIDVLGKVVFIQNEYITKGNVSNLFDFGKLAAGNYTLSIKLKTESKPKFVNIIKN